MSTKTHFISIGAFLLSAGLLSCNTQASKTPSEQTKAPGSKAPPVYKSSLAAAREQFKTKLVKFNQMKEKPETPPKDLFSTVSFGKDHFSGLQPASIIVAKRIMADSLSFEDPLFN
jgi:hypothetical protein